ncbi:uncharacterized protein VICG_01938 [Vittaforma corneae ATCC 50505]|uniref:Uncharacterized protein n=1 Tax=Vittaforma corneae (strain ATCC 50505) TaxID=993615 RepID=L2GJM4_VITCO|nr:uncharacterized protein VICG_01938 [Vittaforma corneae ATCC 50505]ELA41056.1 hypothetical protein VICG_01938 [Vittaforma corneae ATCC 50505]
MIDRNFKKMEKGRKEGNDNRRTYGIYTTSLQHNPDSTESLQSFASLKRPISNPNLYQRSTHDGNIPGVIKAVRVAKQSHAKIPEKVMCDENPMDGVMHLKFDRGGIKMNDEGLYDVKNSKKGKTSSDHGVALSPNRDEFKLIDDARLFLNFIKKIHSPATSSNFNENEYSKYKSYDNSCEKNYSESPELDNSSITCLNTSPMHSYEYLKPNDFPSSLAQTLSYCPPIDPKREPIPENAKSLSKAVVKLKNFSIEGIKKEIAGDNNAELIGCDMIRSRPLIQELNDNSERKKMDQGSRNHFDSSSYKYCKNECDLDHKKQDRDSFCGFSYDHRHSYLFTKKDSRSENRLMDQNKLNNLSTKPGNTNQSITLEHPEKEDIKGAAIEQAKRKGRGDNENSRICGGSFGNFNPSCKIITAKRPSRNIKD